MSKRNLFSQDDLALLSSPEPLDRALRITAPRERLAVIALIGVLVSLIIWSFLAEIPYTVTAQGLLTSNQSQPGKTNVVLSPADGHIVQILVSTGDLVQAGQAVATITLADTGNVIEVTSLYTGKVTRIVAQPDSPILENQSMLSLSSTDNTSGELEAIVYVSFADAQEVTPGLRILIAPETVSRQAFGYMVGSVISLGQFPSVDSFARGLSPINPLIEVRVRLIPDPATASGYQWTLGNGPATALRARTLCDGLIIIREEHPITRVLRFIDPHDYS